MTETFSALLQRFSNDQAHPAERRRRRSGRISTGSNLSEAFDTETMEGDLHAEVGWRERARWLHGGERAMEVVGGRELGGWRERARWLQVGLAQQLG